MPGLDARLDEERLASEDLAQGLAQREPERRHDARHDDARSPPPSGARGVRAQQSPHRERDLVRRRVAARREPPVSLERVAAPEPEDRVRVADVDGEKGLAGGAGSPCGDLAGGDGRLARLGLEPQEAGRIQAQVSARDRPRRCAGRSGGRPGRCGGDELPLRALPPPSAAPRAPGRSGRGAPAGAARARGRGPSPPRWSSRPARRGRPPGRGR